MVGSWSTALIQQGRVFIRIKIFQRFLLVSSESVTVMGLSPASVNIVCASCRHHSPQHFDHDVVEDGRPDLWFVEQRDDEPVRPHVRAGRYRTGSQAVLTAPTGAHRGQIQAI